MHLQDKEPWHLEKEQGGQIQVQETKVLVFLHGRSAETTTTLWNQGSRKMGWKTTSSRAISKPTQAGRINDEQLGEAAKHTGKDSSYAFQQHLGKSARKKNQVVYVGRNIHRILFFNHPG